MSTHKSVDTIKEENENLESFILELYNDKKAIRENIGLLKACILEWHNTNIEIQNDQTHTDNVGPSLGVWWYSNPGAGDRSNHSARLGW
jgi:hypothetical protein